MSVWLDHVKATRKKCPGMSFKEVLIEAKKTYNKSSKKAGPVVCKSPSKKSTKSKKPSKRAKKAKGKKSRKSRKTRKRRRTGKGRKTNSKTKKHKVPKKFKCKLYPNAPDC